MNISDEAVEAAAKAMEGFDPWALVSESRKKLLRGNARKALEAAVPLIAAAAWDEGCGEGLLVNNGWEEGALDANPYRSQA